MEEIIVEQGPAMLVCALNNVCCHGDALIEYGCNLEVFDKEDKVLKEWFEGIDLLDHVAKKLEKMQ